MSVVASFDLGIKNLSYCVLTLDASGSLVSVNRWVNLNLLAGGAESQTQTRCACGGPASFANTTETEFVRLCRKCAKKSAKAPLELEDTSLKGWRVYGETVLGLDAKTVKKLSKKDLEAKAALVRLMPYKAPKAKGVTLQALLAAMEVCISNEIDHLAAADRIRIENQPSEFAPHMKSVQIMLFTLLDHRLRTEKAWTGTMEFANASMKTKGTAATTGKDGKRSRKIAGMERVTKILTEFGGGPWLTWWSTQAKKDDLADAFLMCLNYGGS